MAFFSIYTGALYNEFFSVVTTAVGPSRWGHTHTNTRARVPAPAHAIVE